MIDFFKLDSTSDLIDKGKDVGFAFKGNAPDLGAFESDSLLSVIDTTDSSVFINYNEKPKLNIYPNPVNDRLYVNDFNIKSIEIYDFTGNKYQIKITQNHIDVSYLMPGIYVLQINTSEGNSFPVKVFKR